ncbi:hypothetical protein AAG570_001140 [Ranatra chinensis]|uniref:Cyclic nucleotide-binding domain-containing protein n=1 Tax=Ranatra chinensis TaxID=642074 RepID=A0ABD0YZ58_9HEMI
MRKGNLGWRHIIFLPFNPYWQFAYSVFILTSLYLDLYGLLCLGHVVNMLFIYMIGWIVFFVDASLMTVHKLWGRVARAYHYPTKSWFIIGFTWFTVIPIRYFHVLFSSSTNLTVVEATTILFVHVLRSHRMFMFLKELSYYIGVNQKFITVLAFNMILLVAVNFFAIIWILIQHDRIQKGQPNDWEKYFESRGQFTPEVQYFSALATVFQYYLKNVVINTYENYFPWQLLNIVIMVVGLVYRDLIVPSKLILFHIKSDSHQVQYRTHMKFVRRQLKNLGASAVMEKKVLKYYSDFWIICRGLKEEEFLETLPLCMQKNICLDLNWDPIQHSRALRFCQISFKREISLKIRSEFLRPGDYIFKKENLKKKMYYLVSGVAQLMSDLDGKSPLLSFSSGTVFGGVYTTLPSVSVSDIRCATYCEIREIDMFETFTTIRKYPWEVKPFRIRVFDRIRAAETMMSLRNKLENKRINFYSYQMAQENKLKWLKRRWRTLAAAKRRVEGGEEALAVVETVPVDPTHTSRFLDLIVLSDEMELKQDRFCLRCKWPYVIDPASNFLQVWQLLTTVFIAVETFFLPYYVAFRPAIPEFFRRYLLFMTYMYIVDIYIIFSTAVKTQHSIIVEPMAIIRHRLKSLSCLLEIFSALPIGLSLWLFGSDDRFSSLMELLRLIKFWRIPKYLLFLESDLRNNILLIRLVRHFICLCAIIYFTACFLYLEACYRGECNDDSWIGDAKRQLSKLDNLEEVTCFISPFKYALFFAVSLCLRAHLTTVYLYSLLDVALMMVITLVMVNGIAYAFGQIAATAILERQLKSDYFDLLKRVDIFFSKNPITTNTKNCIDSYLRLQWEYNMACDINFKTGVFDGASSDLKDEISLGIIRILITVPLFAGEASKMSSFVKKTAENARLHVLPRNVTLVYGGMKASSLNIIKRGYCRMTSHHKDDMERWPDGVLLGEGSCFPVPELLSNLPSIVTVRTATECEVVTIKVEDLVKSIRVNRAVNKDINAAIASFPAVKEMYEECLVDQWLPLPRVHRPNFHGQDVNSLPWDKKSFLSYVVLGYTIAPDGDIAFYWEMFKVGLTVISANYFTLYFTLLFPSFPVQSYILAWIFDFCGLLDMYVRCRISYYNEEGLLIENPKMVLKNYLRHSFVVDLLSIIPLHAMVLDRPDSDWAWLIITCAKLLPFYRVFAFYNFLKQDHKVNKYLVFFTMYVVCFVTVLNVASNALAQYACYFRYEMVGSDRRSRVFRSVDCWPGAFSGLTAVTSPYNILAASAYTLLCMYTVSPCPLLPNETSKDMTLLVIISIATLMACLSFRIATCRLVTTGDRGYVDYIEDVSSFMKFVGKEASSGLRMLSLDFCQHVWTYKQDKVVRTAVERAHPSIRRAVFRDMYSAQLRQVSVFNGADASFFTALAAKVVEFYATKSSVVCDKYDLNDSIYFITKGEVEVIVSEAFPGIPLGVGGVFGSFRESGKHRQMFKFVAKVRTRFLVVKTEDFYELLQSSQYVKKKFVSAIQPHKEYLEGAQTFEFRPQEPTSAPTAPKHTHRFSTMSTSYKFVDFFLSYLVPYMTFAFYFTYLACPKYDVLKYALYGLDAVYVLKIVESLTVPFMDEDTGLLVTNAKLIRRGYVYSLRFFFDVLSVIPIEVPFGGGAPLMVNTLLKAYTAFLYMRGRRKKVYVVVSSKWADLTALVPLAAYVSICSWAALLPDRSVFGNRDVNTLVAVFGFLTGITTTRPSLEEIDFVLDHGLMIYTVGLNLLYSILFAVALGRSLDLYQKRWKPMATYETKVTKFKTYVHQRGLSEPLVETAWRYASLQWIKHRGLNTPSLLEDAPYTVKTRLMYNKYSDHLQNNQLFRNCHPDLIRQLCARLKPTHYYQEDYIAVCGDVDHRMYFLHFGEVEVLGEDEEGQEELLGVLTLGDSFGLAQGLYNTQPHFYTYRARTEVVVVYLERAHWRDLRAKFRVDTKIIYRRARDIPFPYERKTRHF